MATDDADQAAVDRYLADIQRIIASAANDNAAKRDVEDYISAFKYNGRDPAALTKSQCRVWRAEITRKAVRKLLKDLEASIKG